MTRIFIRNVEIDGRDGLDVEILNGVIRAIGPALPGRGDCVDGKGAALIPGLTDHHIHILATAARARTLSLERVRSREQLASALTSAAAAQPLGMWIRAAGLSEGADGLPDLPWLDMIVPAHPLRIQDRTGALWMLNSRALSEISGDGWPAEAERDAHGDLTGRFWRCDAWLRSRIPVSVPPLAPLGAELAAFGVTGLTDASVNSTQNTADLLAAAHRSSDLPQQLLLMSAAPLTSPPDAAFKTGPLKILLDDDRLPELEDMVERIGDARRQRRNVAVHCVTASELALTLAAFQITGAVQGDRLEHGGVIPADAIPIIRAHGLTVVTQSGFIHARGDRYLETLAAEDLADLYRTRSLLDAGIPTAGSSDAPYGPTDPWLAMRTAVSRRTANGHIVGQAEKTSSRDALDLYLKPQESPWSRPRRVTEGAPADLCLLAHPIREVLQDLRRDQVRSVFIKGRLVFAQ